MKLNLLTTILKDVKVEFMRNSFRQNEKKTDKVQKLTLVDKLMRQKPLNKLVAKRVIKTVSCVLNK